MACSLVTFEVDMETGQRKPDLTSLGTEGRQMARARRLLAAAHLALERVGLGAAPLLDEVAWTAFL